jgi:predicted RecA/RadA family phage recombinase
MNVTNYKGDGRIVQRVVPVGGCTSGVPIVIGSEFLVPQATADAGATASFIKEGEVWLPSEPTDTFSAGHLSYWNPTSGKVEDADSSANYAIGTTQGAASGNYVQVALNGVALASLTGDLANKIDKVVGATGNVPKFTAAGGLEDGGLVPGAVADGAITTAKLAAGAVTSAKLGAGAVDTAALGALAVTTAKLAAGAVDTTALGADAVTGAKLADDSVDSEHYVDGSIDNAHLSADCVDGTKLADDAVNSEHIASGAMDVDHMAVASVVGTVLAANEFMIELNCEAAATPIDFNLALNPATNRKFRIISTWVHCTGANAGGTLTLYDAAAGGGHAITSAITCAVEDVIAMPSTLDRTWTEIAAGTTVSVVKNAAGDDGRLYLICLPVA